MPAFCPNPDGRGIVLRVWEQAGVSGALAVALPKGMKAEKAQPVNLRGEIAGEPIAVKDGRRLVSYEVNGTKIHELVPDDR